MQIKIQGTIVSADYDCEMFDAWIARGVITPSSRIVAALETADEPVDLYVSSYGGDVFAGGEMQIAILKAAAAGMLNGVEVGSIAASMAANIVASLRAQGVPVAGHSNSQLMFHGCYTSTEGGAQHHEDVAASLRNINDGVIANLNKLGISECRAWFAEGREKWMSADEAVQLKLFTSVADGEAQVIKESKRTASRLAAFASKLTGRTEYTMEIDTQVSTEAEAPKEAPKAEVVEAPAPVEAPEMVTLAECEKRIAEVRAECEKRRAGQQSEKDKEISELKAQLSAKDERLAEQKVAYERRDAEAIAAIQRAEKAEAALADKEAKCADLEAKCADLQAVAETERKNLEAVTTVALTPTPKFKSDAREMLGQLPMSKRAEFYKAHKDAIDK